MLPEQKLTKQILTDQIPNKQIPEPDNQRLGFIKSLVIDQHPSLSALRVGVEEFAS